MNSFFDSPGRVGSFSRFDFPSTKLELLKAITNGFLVMSLLSIIAAKPPKLKTLKI